MKEPSKDENKVNAGKSFARFVALLFVLIVYVFIFLKIVLID